MRVDRKWARCKRSEGVEDLTETKKPWSDNTKGMTPIRRDIMSGGRNEVSTASSVSLKGDDYVVCMVAVSDQWLCSCWLDRIDQLISVLGPYVEASLR